MIQVSYCRCSRPNFLTNTLNSKTEMKSHTTKMHENTTDNFIEKPRNKILSDLHVKDVKHCSTAIVSKKNGKEDDANQSLGEREKNHESVQLKTDDNSLNSRYQLNFRNYIPELHKALIKECNDNLIDYSTLNATLDLESLTNVTARTLKAIKVRYNIE